MATFVLVHPAWFGGWCWKKVAAPLRSAGHAVFTPTLTGLGERAHLASPQVGLGTHIEDVVNVLVFEDLRDVILVGNSSSGFVVAGATDREPDRIAQLVYLDAFVPIDGQSLWDLFPPDRQAVRQDMVDAEGDGWLLPRFAAEPWEQFVPAAWQVTDDADLSWALPRLRPTPFRHFTEPVHLRVPTDDQPPRVYVRCRWPNPAFDRYAAAAQSTPGWSYHELAASHLPYLTDAEALTALLLAIAG